MQPLTIKQQNKQFVLFIRCKMWNSAGRIITQFRYDVVFSTHFDSHYRNGIQFIVTLNMGNTKAINNDVNVQVEENDWVEVKKDPLHTQYKYRYLMRYAAKQTFLGNE